MARELHSRSISPSTEVRGRVLLVDDDASMCEMLAHDLVARGFAIDWFTGADEALARVGSPAAYDAVITDLNLKGGQSGLAVCKDVIARDASVPVIVITGFGSIETAVSAIRLGAYDFITKPFEFEALALTLERAVAHHALKAEVEALRQVVARHPGRFAEFVGESRPMTELYSLISRVAESSATVLVTGESGSGKELVARALHQKSRRSAGPFVAINCGALPETLLESELFGHMRGAFTDARADRPGVFREAEGGTIFLDEIGELPVMLQPKLLRVLQERTVRPLGSNKELPVDVRIIAATNVDLKEAVEQGKFREDLFYRLDVVHLEVPPLRSRGRDTLLLAQDFVTRLARRDGRPVPTLAPEVLQKLLAYDWPGNVRELFNALERAMALNPGDVLRVDALPERIQRNPPGVTPDATEPATLMPLAEMEKRYVLQVLAELKGNKRKAAEVLQLDRSTLYRKLNQYGVTE